VIDRAEVAYQRGILTKPDLNVVQEQLLFAVIHRHKEQDYEDDKRKFEEMMLVNNPAMYDEYKKQKQDEIASGNTGITWITPDSVEEVNELLKVFSDIDDQVKSSASEKEKQADLEFINQMQAMSMFDDIDIDQIGS